MKLSMMTNALAFMAALGNAGLPVPKMRAPLAQAHWGAGPGPGALAHRKSQAKRRRLARWHRG